jgi:SAM-dependent methyltransferase
MTTQLKTLYTPSFYNLTAKQVNASARVCVPLFLDLLHPTSVVDVGCGQGEWLAELSNQGIDDYRGVDGPHIADAQLLIPTDRFDRRELDQPFTLERTFDLVFCLEVAEHLPEMAAPRFVDCLTSLGPAVVFSAAVPGQGGTNHVNEQWPWYWKELFARRGYVQLDPFRQTIWKNPDVAVYYQHNLLLYVNASIHQAIIDRVGVPDKYTELTLVRTTILQEMTQPNRMSRWMARMSRWLQARLPGNADRSGVQATH